MIKRKNNHYIAKLICILIALSFGAYLGTPDPKLWGHPVSEAMTVVSEQIARMEIIKTETDKDQKTGTDKDQKTGTDKDLKEESIAVTETGIKPTPEAPPEEVPEYICLNANRGTVADRKEKDVLVHLINAEAYGLSYKAKVAVGQVVMNRLTSPYYGDDLLTIMTAPHQFTPIHNGSAFKKKVEPDSIKAANAVLAGSGVKELTSTTFYFVNPDFTKDKTIENNMKFVCEIEGIHFFEPPLKTAKP